MDFPRILCTAVRSLYPNLGNWIAWCQWRWCGSTSTILVPIHHLHHIRLLLCFPSSVLLCNFGKAVLPITKTHGRPFWIFNSVPCRSALGFTTDWFPSVGNTIYRFSQRPSPTPWVTKEPGLPRIKYKCYGLVELGARLSCVPDS